jgi:1,4-alpha-glucan branching enzyme
MGCEIAQWHEWNHDESVQWHLLQWESHEGMQRLISDLNRVYREQPALHEVDFEGHGFEWIDCQSADDSVLAFLRKAKDPADQVLVVINFTPVVREHHRVGVPGPGWYQEIFNSDSEHYAGSNVGNYPGRTAEQIDWHGREWSIDMRLPPLATVMFKPET